MNCPCSGVYVCAYIVIFFHRGQREKKKIWVSLWLLFLVSSLDSDLSSKARAQRRSAIHNKYRQAD